MVVMYASCYALINSILKHMEYSCTGCVALMSYNVGNQPFHVAVLRAALHTYEGVVYVVGLITMHMYLFTHDTQGMANYY